MPTVYLDCGPVALQETAGHPKPGQVVGLAPQWSDESDATYADAWISGRSGVTYIGRAYATLPTIPAGATLLSATLEARCEVMNEQNATGTTAYFRVWTPGLGAVVDEAAFALPSVGTIADLQLPLTPANVAAALAVGAEVSAERLTSGEIPTDHGIRVYELRLLVTYTFARRVAHNRVVQRGNDGLGLTGGQRVTQRRTIQASNRVVGIR